MYLPAYDVLHGFTASQLQLSAADRSCKFSQAGIRMRKLVDHETSRREAHGKDRAN